MEGTDRSLVIGVVLDEKGHRLVPVPTAILLEVPFAGADCREEPFHPSLVVEELAVEIARIPAQQDIADIEYDRRGFRTLKAHPQIAWKGFIRSAATMLPQDRWPQPKALRPGRAPGHRIRSYLCRLDSRGTP